VLATTRALPMDPRHNAKVDYTRLQAMIRKGKLSS
jgi:hypothetical protein